ncbi:MAG: nucleotidyltransferase family protein, partial [Chloroflexi bacterium]|nr:nucleotidyltransferase family protein [Chloroflexota bacterium]
FNAAGIPVIALKGAALAHTVYPDPALRPMGDLDLLVAEGRLPAAEATLMGFDYAARERPDRQVRMRGAGKHSPALSSPGGAVVFELHRHIVNHFPHYDLAGFWERARPATLAGQTALVPAPEDMLIHLSLHFFGDRLVSGRGAIGQLWDIAMTVRRAGDSFDWALLTAETRRFGLKGPVGLALAAAHAFFGTPSEGQVRSLAPEAFDVAAVRRFLERRVLAGGERYANGLVEANTEYSARNAARGVLAFLFPTPTYLDDRRALLGSPEGTGALYLRHYLRLPRHILTALRQARSSLRDLQPDRFMHRLAQYETGPDRSPE